MPILGETGAVPNVASTTHQTLSPAASVVTPAKSTHAGPTSTGGKGIRPFALGTLTFWQPIGASTDGTDPNNWSAGLPNANNPGIFDALHGTNDCNLVAITCAGFIMDSNYHGNVTFGGAASLGELIAYSEQGTWTMNAIVGASTLDVEAGTTFTGSGSFDLNPSMNQNGTINVPAQQVFNINLAGGFIDNGYLVSQGSIYLGNGTTGTSNLDIWSGAALVISGTSSFNGTNGSVIRVGDATNGGGILQVRPNVSVMSGVSVWLRGAGSDLFSLRSGSTWDWNSTTMGYTSNGNSFNSVCLAVSKNSTGTVNFVSLLDGSTMNLFNYAVIDDALAANFINGGNTVTIGSHAGTTATLVMNKSTSQLAIGQGNGSGFGTLQQNTNVTWNGGVLIQSISFPVPAGPNSWSADVWNFGTNNTLTIPANCEVVNQFTTTSMPNPYGQNVPMTNVPAGIINNGSPGYVFRPTQGSALNGWSAQLTGGILRPTTISLMHP
jgi:hypothetical protein